MNSMKQLPSLVAAVALVGSGFTTFNNARQLKPGEHAAAVTVCGALTDVPGVATIPLPNITVEGRHGFIEHLDVNYGVHLLPTLFGAAGGFGGGAVESGTGGGGHYATGEDADGGLLPHSAERGAA